MRELEFSERTLRRQWQLVNQWFENLNPDASEPVEQLLALVQATLEMSLQLHRHRHLSEFRAHGVWDKANGYYTRSLDTTFGSVPQLRVPRLRQGLLPPLWFRRYQRRWQKVDRLVLQCFLGGLSTRKAAKILNRHFGWGLSPSLVSRLASHLHEALQRYQHCALHDQYVALIVDGAWYRFRQLQGPKRVVLAVLGVKPDRTVVLLGFHVARSESSLDVARLLRDLKARGLSGRRLELLVADGAGGIEAAAAEVYPWARLQRCCWHQLQLLRTHASGQKIARCLMREAARCYHSTDARQVQRNLQAFLARWRTRQPCAIRAFATDLDKTLTYLRLPPELHRSLRTTNLLERLIRELRQRTKLIGSFDQPVHLEQLLLGTIVQSTWIQLPVTLQPLLTPDTII